MGVVEEQEHGEDEAGAGIVTTVGSGLGSVLGSAPGDPSLQSGDCIGRYRLVRRLGSGGMGVVWFAHDPRLDRTVAIKVLHEQPRGSGAMARERLRREALALARLSHPNVVSIYDVGIHDRRVFLAMEYIEGHTLDVWAARGPSLDQVLAVFEQAAAGLAAVHEAGFIHRDFKPANVMIDGRGRVAVMDFGLARIYDPKSASELEDTALSSPVLELESSRLLSTTLTIDGVVMGTPAYMAPEQHTGAEADARSDQFSLCAALYEALLGRRPFWGRSVKELAQQKYGASLDLGGGRLPLPRPLRALLRRGLDPQPDRRFPDMRALRAALVRLRQPARSRRLAWSAAGVLVMGGTGWVGLTFEGPSACVSGAEHLAEVWNDGARARLRRAFEATGRSYADDAATRATERLDAYARDWSVSYRQACEASANDVATLDLRMECLSKARSSMAQTVGLLFEADPTGVQHAVAQVTGLPAVARCDDVAALQAEVSPPGDPVAVAAVEQIASTLESAHALERAGHYAKGRERAAQALASAQAVEHEPSIARARIRVASLDLHLGDSEAARRGLTEAALLAAGVGDHPTAADAATRLVYVYAEALGRPDEALPWARHAGASLRRMPPDPLAQARLHSNLAIVRAIQARYGESVELFTRAYEAKREILGPSHPEVAQALENIALSTGEQGRLAEAEAIHRRSLATLESALGASHPDFGLSLMNLGQAVDMLGHHDEAAEHYTRALGIFRAALGPDHPLVGHALGSLGHVAAAQDRLDEAEAYYRQAKEITAATVGERHREFAWSLLDLAMVTSQLSRDEEALELYARAREILEQTDGEEHDSFAYLLMNESISLVELARLPEAEAALDRAGEIIQTRLPSEHPARSSWHAERGELRRAQGKLRSARQEFEAALGIAEVALGPEHPETAGILQSLGEVEHTLGDSRSARAHLRRALGIIEAGAVGEAFRSSVRFSLARVLWDEPATRAEAEELAARARDGFAAYGDLFDDDVEEIDRWSGERHS
ncbi:MAG: serine/threonine-protein kinase [Myxococcota bacterium]